MPNAWRPRLGQLTVYDTVNVETASQAVVTGDICGPVLLRFGSFRQVLAEVLFIDMELADGRHEALLGYIPLEQAQAVVDLSGHRLAKVDRVISNDCRPRPLADGSGHFAWYEALSSRVRGPSGQRDLGNVRRAYAWSIVGPLQLLCVVHDQTSRPVTIPKKDVHNLVSHSVLGESGQNARPIALQGHEHLAHRSGIVIGVGFAEPAPRAWPNRTSTPPPACPNRGAQVPHQIC